MDVQFLIVFLLVAICAEPIGMAPMAFINAIRGSSQQFNHEVTIQSSNGTIVKGSIIHEGRHVLAPARVSDDWQNSHIHVPAMSVYLSILECERAQNVHLVLLTPSIPVSLSSQFNANSIKTKSSFFAERLDKIRNTHVAKVKNVQGTITILGTTKTVNNSMTVKTNYLGELPAGSSLTLQAKGDSSQLFIVGLFDHSESEEAPKRKVSVFALADDVAIRTDYPPPNYYPPSQDYSIDLPAYSAEPTAT